MNATDVLTIDTWTGDLDVAIDGNPTPVKPMPAMAEARFGASLTLAFQIVHMGAGLGWHGTVAESSPSTQVERSR